jgi:pimeloyl-ACP methyl ester carboxylesterase
MLTEFGKALAQTHYIERELNGEFGVRALLAIKPNRKAILFVHGYSGDAISTWSDFNKVLPGDNRFSGHDLLFYGYDGLRGELIATVGIFRNFMDWLFGDPLVLINHALGKEAHRPEGFAYDHVLVVAHSLGAVVARWAIIKATTAKSFWSNKTSLLLFAPAHMGANIVQLVIETASSYSILKLGVGVARIKSPLIDQLKKGSDELGLLASEFTSAMAKNGNQHLIAKKVCIAQFEHVVSNKTFCADPEPSPIQGSTHKSICKPRPGFNNPILALRECIP